MKIWVLCITTLLGSVSSLTAQESNCRFEIKGQVIDLNSKLPVPDASVTIAGTTRNVITEELGHFNLNRICKGRVTLVIKVKGYHLLTEDFYVERDSSITLTLSSNTSLKEITILSKKTVVKGTNTSSTVTQKQLEQTRGGTLTDALQNVEGVNALKTGATIAKPVIHGLHSNRILILNNGIRQEGQQWGMEHSPEIDPLVANQITVIKGAEGIRFGPEAIGGVILVEPAPLSKESKITAELNLTGAENGKAGTVSGHLDGGLKKLPGFAWRIQGTGKKSGNIRTADYYLENTGVREANFSGTLGYAKKGLSTEIYLSHFNTDIGIFSGAHIGSIEDLQARIINGRPFEQGQFSYSIDAPRQKVEHNLLKLKGHIHIKNNVHVDFLYGLQQNKRKEYDIRRGGRSSIPSLDLALTTQTFDLSLENITEKGWKNTLGFNGLVQVNNNVPGTLATPLIPNYDTYSGGAYLITKLFKNSYELEAGMRYDFKYMDALGYDQNQELYGTSQTFSNISASLGAVIYLSNNWSLRSNLGSAWRPPSANELYSNGLHHGSAAFERGSINLLNEKSYKWINSTEFSSEKIDLSLSLFFNHIKNYIYLKPSGELYESIRGVFPTFDYHQTNALFTGSDLSLTYHFNRPLYYEMKGSMVRAKDVTTHNFLPWIPSDRLANSIGYRFKHPKNSKTESFIQLSHQFVAKQTRYNEASDYAVPPASYHLFNANAGISFSLSGTRISLNTSINNISNKLYKEYMNRLRYYAHDQGRNITLRALLKF